MSTKEQILAALQAEEGYVSGESLAQTLQISRNAVWKAITQLREEGFEIESFTNRGYRLTNGCAMVSETGIRRWLTAKEIGSRIEVHDVIDSTNTRAKELAAQGAPHGMLVCARSQTGGRGRFGRKFHSPQTGGIYISIILRPQLPADRAVMTTSMAAVAVAQAIEKLADVDVKIKWVNDLYIAGKKTCGILCEAGMDFESGQLEYVVVGIGVNTSPAQFPEELENIATSVGNVCGHDISKDHLIAEICNGMEALLPRLADGGFMKENKRRSNVIGRDIVVLRGGERFPARAVDIDEEGSLVVETADGIQIVHSGEVSVRWEDHA